MLLEIPLERLLKKPITESGLALLNRVISAHDLAATTNHNCSSAACVNAVVGSGRFENGVASAILSLGDNHGPISGARHVYETFTRDDVHNLINSGQKVPGFGNSFFKDSIDPSWSGVNGLIISKFDNIHDRISELSSWVNSEKRKPIYPNAALFTAAACSEIGVIPGLESAIFILARIPAWGGLCRA